MAEDAERWHSFLERLGRAQASSAEETADLWAVPSMLVDLYDTPAVFDDRTQLIEALRPAYSIYRRLGLATIRALEFDSVPITESLTRLKVRWSFGGADDVLIDPSFEYVVRINGDDPLVCFAVAIDLSAKLRRVARERDIQLED